MKRRFAWLWAVVALILLFLLGVAFFAGMWLAPEIELYHARTTVPLPPFGEVWVLLEQQFYSPLPPAETRLHGAIRGILTTLNDPYTILVDPQPAQQEQQRLTGSYGDVGVTLWWLPGGGVGLTPYPDGPAARAGVLAGDRLLAIAGQPLSDTLNLDDVSWQLQGEVGTTVTLTLLHPPTLTQTLTVVREEVLHPSVTWRWVDAEAGIGYLDSDIFTGQSAAEIRQTLTEAADLHALILDLRGNGGGVIAPLAEIGGMFLPPGTVMYYAVKQSQETPVEVQGTVLFSGPLVILVDGNTASAAEILAAALRERGHAVLVGKPTYGKDSIQSLYPLRDGSTLHVTNGIWLTSRHERLDGKGLQPEISVTPALGRDTALEAALEQLHDTMP